MHSLRKAAFGFILALMATMALGAQSLPAQVTVETAFGYLFQCIPEALFAPLFFPLTLCYWGCGLSDQLLGAAAVPAFSGDLLQAFVRASFIGLAFWTPWIMCGIFPRLLLEENEGEV